MRYTPGATKIVIFGQKKTTEDYWGSYNICTGGVWSFPSTHFVLHLTNIVLLEFYAPVGGLVA